MQSDGTISVEGVRFEIPGRYTSLPHEVTLRYARWDLGWRVDLVDPPRVEPILAPIYPLDKSRQRRVVGES